MTGRIAGRSTRAGPPGPNPGVGHADRCSDRWRTCRARTAGPSPNPSGGTTPDGPQHLLGRAGWGAAAVRDDIRDHVPDHPADDRAFPAADGTGDLKRTPWACNAGPPAPWDGSLSVSWMKHPVMSGSTGRVTSGEHHPHDRQEHHRPGSRTQMPDLNAGPSPPSSPSTGASPLTRRRRPTSPGTGPRPPAGTCTRWPTSGPSEGRTGYGARPEHGPASHGHILAAPYRRGSGVLRVVCSRGRRVSTNGGGYARSCTENAIPLVRRCGVRPVGRDSTEPMTYPPDDRPFPGAGRPRRLAGSRCPSGHARPSPAREREEGTGHGRCR